MRPEPLAATAGPPEGRASSRVPIRVRFGETDLMAIAHHGSYLLWFEEARVDVCSVQQHKRFTVSEFVVPGRDVAELHVLAH